MTNICGGVLWYHHRTEVVLNLRPCEIASSPFFSSRHRSGKDIPLGRRFRCCANCRYYVPHHTVPMLDGPSSSYCRHPERVHSHYISDETDVAVTGIYRRQHRFHR